MELSEMMATAADTMAREIDALVAEHLFGWRWAIRPLEPHFGRLLIPDRALADKTLNYADGTPRWTAATGNEKLQDNWINAGLVPRYTTWAGVEAVASNRIEAGYYWIVKSPYETWEPYWVGLHPMGVPCDGHPDFYHSGPTEPIARCVAALASAGVRYPR